ncbi:MAG: hypothetical protein JWR38_4942 [Mucilaginibacter sp.]|nr:hypothetical protein [Mucilaginibacter sp.]
MKSIIAGALAAGLVAVCLSVNVQAKSLSPVSTVVSTTAVSDTGKMDKMSKGKMDKMSKMDKKKEDKMDKMSKSKMDKMGKKKMAKEPESKM